MKNKTLTRYSFITAGFFCLSNILLPKKILASQVDDQTTSIKLFKTDNGYNVYDESTGDYVSTEIDNDHLTVYLNGNIIISQFLYPEIKETISLFSIPSGFRYVGTIKYGNMAPFAVLYATLASLGLGGYAGKAASAIISFVGSNGPAYLSIDQYIRGTQGFWVCNFYKNSNYTGQFYKFEAGPFTSSRP